MLHTFIAQYTASTMLIRLSPVKRPIVPPVRRENVSCSSSCILEPMFEQNQIYIQGDTYGHKIGLVEVLFMFHWLVGRFCNCPAAHLVGGTSQFNVNKSFSMTIRVALGDKFGL